MGVAKKEPIIEIFASEAGDSIGAFDKYMLEGVKTGDFGRELIVELSKFVRIIRRDAGMLLFDGIAQVSGKLEKLLDCYRDVRAEKPEFEPFKEVLEAYSEFIHSELYKLTHNERVNGDNSEIIELIDHMDTGVVGFNKLPTSAPGGRKQYYIPSKQEKSAGIAAPTQGAFDGLLLDEAKKPEDGLVKPKTPTEILSSLKNRLINFNITDDKMEEIRRLSVRLENVMEKLKAVHNDDIAEDLDHLAQGIKAWVMDARMMDFSMVVSKAKLATKDLLKHTGKKAEFVVKGLDDEEHILHIEKYKTGNLSKAITHLIRNAVDHGIEMPLTRVKAGKSEEGHITLEFIKSDRFKGVEIHFSDDGAGINPDKILKAAEMRGILLKPKESYSLSDILKIPFMTGFTTRKTIGDYSGRGVGLDQVAHLIEEINGRVMLKSREGEGTEVDIELPYDHVSE